WQVNRAEQPFGPSPMGFNWGATPWDVAMQHAASEQLGASKRFLESLPWTRLAPARDAVRFVLPTLKPIDATGARWVWPADPKPRMTLVGAAFDLPTDRALRHAILRLVCDVPHDLMLNGQMVYRTNNLDYHDKHGAAQGFPLAGEYLRPGRNRIVLRIDKEALAVGRGLLAHLHVEFSDGTARDMVSDASWQWAQPDQGWPGDVLVMEPSGWQAVEEADAPRADVGSVQFAPSAASGPHCARLPENLWVLYVPAAIPVELAGLPSDAALELIRFDPRNGAAGTPEPVGVDPAGRWQWQPPRRPATGCSWFDAHRRRRRPTQRAAILPDGRRHESRSRKRVSLRCQRPQPSSALAHAEKVAATRAVLCQAWTSSRARSILTGSYGTVRVQRVSVRAFSSSSGGVTPWLRSAP
ncbi:hypothetical protein HQ560_17830, partial [bacterium]|nr:hypothetical protein [bacterium]